jgi:hypothetical protein
MSCSRGINSKTTKVIFAQRAEKNWDSGKLTANVADTGSLLPNLHNILTHSTLTIGWQERSYYRFAANPTAPFLRFHWHHFVKSSTHRICHANGICVLAHGREALPMLYPMWIFLFIVTY